ncbi:MAG: hypothetical protein EOP22_14975 [Hyphomicrobiales bacterium]|nr:MAG: hypothetical protein EOP22_14975 [Hyphomicrobiales bacterium]
MTMSLSTIPIPTWLMLAVVALFGAAVVIMTLRYRAWKRGWLSSEVERRLSLPSRGPAAGGASIHGATSRIRRLPLAGMDRLDFLVQYFGKRFYGELRDWRSPSLASFFVLTAVVASVFMLARFPIMPDRLPSFGEIYSFFFSSIEDQDGRVSSLVTGAFGALAVVVIALVVLVAESIRDDTDQERKRILLRLSLLWPLGLLATLIPIGFLWISTSRIVIVMELVVAGLTIYAFSRLIANLLNPVLRERQRVAFLEGRVRNIVRQSARERIANNVLAETVGSTKPVSTFTLASSRSWIESDSQSLIFIDAPKSGRLVDVQLEELKKLGDRIDWITRTHFGVSLLETGPTRPLAALVGSAVPRPYEFKKAYFLKRFGDEVPDRSLFVPDGRTILAFPAEIAQRPDAMAEIETSLPHIFRFSAEEASSTIFRRELQATKDEMVSAISAQAVSKVDELRTVYLKVAEQFLETLGELGGGYSADQARHERSALSGEWDEVGWLRTDISELAAVALRSDSTTIAGKVGYLPFAIATRAVRARDHLLFQQFLSFATHEYFLARQIQNPHVRSFMLERTWRWTTEVADFFVEKLITSQESTIDDVNNGMEFALHVIRTFQDLLKEAGDHDDPAYFDDVFTQFSGVFSGVARDVDDWSVALALNAGRSAKTLPELREASSGFDKAKARLSAKRQIELAKGAVAFAIAGRLSTSALKGVVVAKKLLKVVTASLRLDIVKLVGLFSYASSDETATTWGWEWWDLSSDGRVHTIDTQSAINRAFIIVVLEALAREPSLARLPLDKELADLTRADHPHSLTRLLDEVELDPVKWTNVIDPVALAMVGTMRNLLVELHNEDLAAEARRTRNASLDSERLADFSNNVFKSHRSSVRLRTILESLGV